jgi:hypothetical protein
LEPASKPWVAAGCNSDLRYTSNNEYPTTGNSQQLTKIELSRPA